MCVLEIYFFFFFQAEDGIRDKLVTGVQTCALPISHIPPVQFPGVALAVELYLEGGIRSVEIGTLMFGEHATMDLVRLAIPRRVYTQSHIDYVVEVILEVWRRRAEIRGFEIAYQAPFLRHFTARFRPVLPRAEPKT